MKAFLALLQRDLRLSWRHRAESITTISFFALIAGLFPLAVSPEPAQLIVIASGVLWIAAALAMLLPLPYIFQDEEADGSLELLALSPLSLEQVALVKAVVHWLVCGLPLVCMSPLFGLFYQLPMSGWSVLSCALLIGTPALSLLGGFGAALTLKARHAGMLLALLILPLSVPVLIFGAGAGEAALSGLPVYPYLLLLSSCTLAALTLVPFATAAALRQALRSG